MKLSIVDANDYFVRAVFFIQWIFTALLQGKLRQVNLTAPLHHHCIVVINRNK